MIGLTLARIRHQIDHPPTIESLAADPFYAGRVPFSLWAPWRPWHGASLTYRPAAGETWRDAWLKHLTAHRDAALAEEEAAA